MSRRVHDWIPLAIVVVSVLAAVMGWRASLADEAATHTDELGRQDLVLQQEVLLQKVQGVASDIRAFGPYEEYSILGDQLLKDARRVTGPTGQLLAREGQGDVETARGMGSDFRYTSEYAPADPINYGPGGTLEGSGAYKPGNPYPVAAAAVAAQSGDPELTSLEPNQLRADARAQRRRGVQLIGLAALFITGLVFLTLAAVSARTRVLWLSACGMTVAVLGLVLFPLVELA